MKSSGRFGTSGSAIDFDLIVVSRPVIRVERCMIAAFVRRRRRQGDAAGTSRRKRRLTWINATAGIEMVSSCADPRSRFRQSYISIVLFCFVLFFRRHREKNRNERRRINRERERVHVMSLLFGASISIHYSTDQTDHARNDVFIVSTFGRRASVNYSSPWVGGGL